MISRKTKKPPVQPITELLHEDHQKVYDLFFKFDEAEKGSEKERILKQILMELYVHSAVEEEIVYPAVKEEGSDAEDLTEEAETEHRMVKYLMAELSNMKSSEDLFEAKVTVLCELVKHHVREEEKEMFEKLRESDANEELSRRVMERKEALMNKPMPSMKANLMVGMESGKGQQNTRKTSTATRRSTGKVQRRKSA
jgi:hemerythrin superfamily protein